MFHDTSVHFVLIAGVLGPAMIEAEKIEAAGVSDCVAVSSAVQKIYSSTTFRFDNIPVLTASSGNAASVTLVKRPATFDVSESEV